MIISTHINVYQRLEGFMTFKNGKWQMSEDDLDFEDAAYRSAAEALLPLIRIYKKGVNPLEGGEHMSLCYALHTLAGFILRREPMAKSKNIDLLTIPDWQGKEVGKKWG